jgi:DGQHR domain-containing protein
MEIHVLRVRQPIGDFYVGVISWASLVSICRTDVRRLVRQPSDASAEQGDVFAYMGIQRPLSPSRVAEIQEYVRAVDACFPNTIIISVPSSHVKSGDGHSIWIRKQPDVATVIDGQHRLAGFSGQVDLDFDLAVTIFVDMEVQQQAYLFSTINAKQVRINPSLARDLLDFSSIDTPEKVAHNIAKAMNADPLGPWNYQIKMLGRQDEISKGIITQHMFVTELIDLMYSAQKYQNRARSLLKEAKNDRTVLRTLEVDGVRYPFWALYLEGRDDAIRKVMDNYFSAVCEAFPDDWLNPSRILSKTTGYQALMLQLRMLVPLGLRQRSLTKEFFLPYLRSAHRRLEELERPLTVVEFGLGRGAAAELRLVMFGEEQ